MARVFYLLAAQFFAILACSSTPGIGGSEKSEVR
jgi:hypothetical protein